MPQNILLSMYDWASNAFGNAVISGGGFSADLPATNMLSPQPQWVAEATGSSVSFDVDLLAPRSIGLIHLQNLLVDAGATISVTAGSYSSGIVSAWPSDQNGLYDGVEFVSLGRPRIFVVDPPVVEQTVSISISGTSAPLRIGYVGVCETWQPPYNMSYGWRTTYLDLSDVSRVPYGSTWIIRRPKFRRLSFGIDWVPDDRPYVGGVNYVPLARRLMVSNGMSAPVMAVPFPDDPDNIEREAVWGLFSAAPEISNPFYARYATTFQIDQLV